MKELGGDAVTITAKNQAEEKASNNCISARAHPLPYLSLSCQQRHEGRLVGKEGGRRAASFRHWSRASPSFFSIGTVWFLFPFPTYGSRKRLRTEQPCAAAWRKYIGVTDVYVRVSVRACMKLLTVSVYFERLYAILLSTEEETQATAKRVVSAFRVITPFDSFSEGGSSPEE